MVYALRRLAREAGVRFFVRRKATFTVAVLTMALALGANTLAFSALETFRFKSRHRPYAPAKGLSHVANIKSQKKRNLTNAKAADRNKAVKSELRTRVKTAVKSIGSDDTDEAVRLAVKRLDMAAAKGIIHPNQAARRKSRLMKKVAAAG